MACSSLTMTSGRLSVVDFTHPFKTVGLVLLCRRPTPDVLPAFSCLEEMLDFNLPCCVISQGSSMQLLQKAKNPLYVRLCQHLISQGDTAMVHSLHEGIHNVLYNGMSFITTEDYAHRFVNTIPGLMVVDLPFLELSYGLITQIGSPLCRLLNHAILHMAESCEIEQLCRKWF